MRLLALFGALVLCSAVSAHAAPLPRPGALLTPDTRAEFAKSKGRAGKGHYGWNRGRHRGWYATPYPARRGYWRGGYYYYY
jgi:hypothetical protein